MKLNLIEIFASIQGETSRTGLPTTFIRLARCNLRCSWCDTPYSFSKGASYSFDKILEVTENFGCRFVCITGGEPLLQDKVHDLMTILCDLNYKVSIETGGSLSIEKIDPRVKIVFDIKCPGSGMSQKNLWENIPLLKKEDEIKFVIQNEEDYQFAKTICLKYSLFDFPNVLFSPVHGVCEGKNLVKWILNDRLNVRLNVQIHKFIWDPITQGV